MLHCSFYCSNVRIYGCQNPQKKLLYWKSLKKEIRVFGIDPKYSSWKCKSLKQDVDD